MSKETDQPVTELRAIVQLLRPRLPETVQTLEPTRAAMGVLQVFLTQLSEMDRLLLPKRKQRAVQQMTWALTLWSRDPEWVSTTDDADEIKRLMDVLAGSTDELTPDWTAMADRWVELVRPRWADYLQGKGRKASLRRLRDLEPSLRKTPIEVAVLLKKMQTVEFCKRWDERIVACILGHGTSDGAS